MYTYNILKDGFIIGTAKGQHKAFEFIQKEVDRQGLIGYWKGEKYIHQQGEYTFERMTE